MKNLISKLDFTLIFRLSLSLLMLVAAFRQSDFVSGAFGVFLAIYAIIGAKYKIGCGYNNCGYVPRYHNKNEASDDMKTIDYTEIK